LCPGTQNKSNTKDDKTNDDFKNAMKKQVSRLNGDVSNLTLLIQGIKNSSNQVYRLTDDVSNLTTLVKDMKKDEKIFQKRLFDEIGKYRIFIHTIFSLLNILYKVF
jgi:hypothetical protein